MLAERVESPTKKLGVLFEQVYRLFVPRYQRGYSWEEEQVEAFVADLYNLTEQRLAGTSDQAHFFGSIVTVGRADPQSDSIAYEIVDGQQRITTTVLLLAALASAFEGIEKRARKSDFIDEISADLAVKRANEIRTRYLYQKVYDGPDEVTPKLQSNKSDNDVLQQLVTKGMATPQRASHQLLLDSYNLLVDDLVNKYASKPDLSDAIAGLDALKQAITSDCYLIHVITESKSSANRLFSVLNNRGKQIGPSDLLRADLMEELDAYPVEQEQVASLWDELSVKGVDKLDNFFLAYFPSTQGKRCSEAYYADYSDKIFQFSTKKMPANKRVTFVERLLKEYRAYCLIVDGIWPFTPTSSATSWDKDRLTRTIGLLRHALATPLILAASQNQSEETFARLVHTIERFAFRYKNICGGHTAAASRAYYDAATSCRNGTFDLNSFEAHLGTLLKDSADDETFALKLRNNLNYSKTAQRGNIKELLTTLEDYNAWNLQGQSSSLKPVKSRLWALEKVDIEHIYPQSSQSTDSKIEPLKHGIGNLTFWDQSDNRSQGNANFSTKKAHYVSSAVSSNHVIAQSADWTSQSIKSREDLIVRLACQVFTIG